MTTLRLVLSEFKRLTSGITPLITLIGLSLIPLLYSGVYLYANWDPYGNVDQLKAAIVSEDTGAELDDEYRVLGDDVVEELVDDASFNWEIVESKEIAEDSVYRGDYQFALIIPERFSEALASPSSFESAEQATLEFITNDANNYLLGNIVERLGLEVHASVTEQVGQETADAMLTGFGRIHLQLVEAHSGAEELQDGSEDLHSGITELHDGSISLAEGIEAADEGLGELSQGVSDLSDGSSQLTSGADDLATGAGELSSGLSELSDGVGELESGAGELSSGATELSAGLTELSSGAEEVAQGNELLSAASHEASSVISEFEDDAETRTQTAVEALIDAGILTEEQVSDAEEALESAAADSELLQRAAQAREELASGQESIDELAEGAREVADGAAELAQGATTLSSGASELNDSVPELIAGVDQAHSGANELSEGATDLSSGATELDEGIATLGSGVGELQEGASALVDGSSELEEGLSTASEGSADLADGAQELADGLSSGVEEVPNPDEAQQEELAEVMANPVRISDSSQASAENYGTGMSPFFLALSLWIGALVLLQVLRASSARALATNAWSATIAAASWLPFVVISFVQTLVLYGVLIFGLGLEPAHPWAALFILLASAMAFTAIIQGIVALLGNPGKMVALVLLILQLVASGGMFPIGMLPGLFQAMHPFLPMSYVVDALRHVIFGGDVATISTAFGALFLLTVIGFAIQWIAAQRNKTWSLRRLEPPIEETT